MTLAEKIEWIREQFNEVAFGWNDSGCFWHFRYGPRGAGDMMEGFGQKFDALDAESFEEAVDHLLEHLRRQLSEEQAVSEQTGGA